MFLPIISGFLCISMVFAGGIQNLHVKYLVNDDGNMMRQDVGLSYEDNCIQVNTAALDGKTPATIIHDTTEHMTELRQGGHCFLLSNGFEEVFSTDMDEWHEDKEAVQQMRSEDVILYNYTAVPFCLDREKIPSMLQDECDEVYPAVLVNILRGQDAYNSLEYVNTPYVTKAYGPAIQYQDANSRRGGGRGYRKQRNEDPVLQGFLTVLNTVGTILGQAAPIVGSFLPLLAGK